MKNDNGARLNNTKATVSPADIIKNNENKTKRKYTRKVTKDKKSFLKKLHRKETNLLKEL